MQRPPLPPAAALQLDAALQLIRQSGQLGPAGTPGTNEWLQGVIDALVDLSSRDPLTGLVNRRQFESALDREIDRVARLEEERVQRLAALYEAAVSQYPGRPRHEDDNAVPEFHAGRGIARGA